MALELHPENNLSIANNLSADGDINTNSKFLSSGVDISNFFGYLSANKIDKWLSAGYILVGDDSGIAVPVSADGDVSIGLAGVTKLGVGKIFDVNVAETASISGTKIIPTFGNQTITTEQGIIAKGGLSVQGPILSSGQDISSLFISSSLQEGKMWMGNSLNVAQPYTITGEVSVGNGGIANIVPYSIRNIHVANNAGISGIKIIPNFWNTVNVFGAGINVDGGAVIKQDTYTANLNAQGVWIPEQFVYNWLTPQNSYTIPAHWEQGDITARQDIEAGRDISAGGKIVANGDIQTFGRFMSGNHELINILRAQAFITRTELGLGQTFIGQSTGLAQPKTVFGEVSLSSTGFASITPGIINDSHISPTAAISGTKIIPTFGNQTITTEQEIVAQKGISVQGPILSGGQDIIDLAVNKTSSLYLPLTGGTVSGPVTITNGNLTMGPGTHLLSGGLDLSEILESVIVGDYLPTGGGTITGGLIVDQNLTVKGDLIVEGSVSQVNTEVHVTSALSINNNGTGLALEVSQTGSGDVANFFSDEKPSILKINQNGFVGINTGIPECELDVNGSVRFDVLSANNGYFTQTLTATDGYFAQTLTATNLNVAENITGSHITALSGLSSFGGATVSQSVYVGNDIYAGGMGVMGQAYILSSVWIESGGLSIGEPFSNFSSKVLPKGSLTTTDYIKCNTWLTVGSAAVCNTMGSIVADGFGEFGKYVFTQEGVSALGDIQTVNRFLSGNTDLSLIIRENIKDIGEQFFIPLTGCTSTKTVSGNIDLTNGGKYLSGGVDISSMFGASLPVLAEGQTYVGVGNSGIVNAMYLKGGDVYLADTTGTLNISAERITTAHISAGAITDYTVSSAEADRISGTKILPSFGTQTVDTSGSYLLSGIPLLNVIDSFYLPLVGGTLTGPLSVSTSSSDSTLTLTQSGAGALITANNSTSAVFTVLSDGNVGINTVSPIAPLHVKGNILSEGTLKADKAVIANGSSASVFYTSGNRVGVNTQEPNVELTVVGSISSTGSIFTDKFRVAELSADSVIVNSLTASSGNIETFVSTNATLTANTLVTSELTAAKVIVSDLSATTITAEQGIFSKLLATDFSGSVLTLNNDDSGKIFHLDTMTSNITAVFPSSLSVGFNIGLMNVGTGTIYISSAQPGFINAYLGVNTNKTMNTGMFVYKHNNNQIYGVGMFNPL